MRLLLIGMCITACAMAWPACGEKAASAKSDESRLRDIGIPVRSVTWVQLHAGRTRGGDPCLYVAMGQTGDNLFVLQVDPQTGKFRQFASKVASTNYPRATLMSRSGRLYIGAAYAGRLLCFDPTKDGLEDLGAIHAGAATFPCQMDEDRQGRIWIGSYSMADLTCYDPASRHFVHYGRMDPVDMYTFPLVNTDGTIACLIGMTRPHVMVFDPKTKQKQVVGPVTTAGEQTIDLLKGIDGRLYIRSSVGNFRIEGTKAVPVAAVPAPWPAATLPGVQSFFFADAEDQIYRKLEIRKADGTARTFTLDYAADGSRVFCLHAGPDGFLYGSSILPLHLFRYCPRQGSLADLGKCSSAGGEAYSMANYQGKIFISAYSRAMLSVFDPRRPYHLGSRPEDNPRDLGPIDAISCRPRSTLAGPLGRVWLASVPISGRWGGALSCYDPTTEKKTPYYRLCGDASCYTLAHLESEKLLAVGTSIFGGSGTQPKVKQAQLCLWDYQAERKVWEGTLDHPVAMLNALLVGPDGRLYGTAIGERRELFVFDPKVRRFVGGVRILPGNPLDLGLQNGPDGKIYGFTSDSIYRLEPSSLRLTEVIRAPSAFDIAGPILGSDIYFATGQRLRAAKLFGD